MKRHLQKKGLAICLSIALGVSCAGIPVYAQDFESAQEDEPEPAGDSEATEYEEEL